MSTMRLHIIHIPPHMHAGYVSKLSIPFRIHSTDAWWSIRWEDAVAKLLSIIMSCTKRDTHTSPLRFATQSPLCGRQKIINLEATLGISCTYTSRHLHTHTCISFRCNSAAQCHVVYDSEWSRMSRIIDDRSHAPTTIAVLSIYFEVFKFWDTKYVLWKLTSFGLFMIAYMVTVRCESSLR